MKLVLDFGNTLIKIASFVGEEIDKLMRFSNEDFSIIQNYLSGFSEATYNKIPVILSSVINYPESFSAFMHEKFNFIELNANTNIPIINKYKSPSSLGKDRLAAIVGGNNLFPGSNVLVIESGSCITYDIITQNDEYLGGGISPGVSMRFKALHTFTDKLPLLSYTDYSELIGRTTEESILSGVLNGVASELEGIIEKYQEEFEDLKIILSGGDMNYFDKRLKNNIFAVPNLVLFGLNVILEYNVGSK
jgi:type III pantothenate kinase